MIASGNIGRFLHSNQCAKDFLKETCGFSGHVSDRQAFAGGGKTPPEMGRRNVDRGWIGACLQLNHSSLNCKSPRVMDLGRRTQQAMQLH
jgi:hypothetical protein